MSIRHPITLYGVLLCAASLAPLASAAEREPVVAPDVYVSCEYRVAAIFPGFTPAIRDTTFTVAGKTVPAREFYVQRGTDKFSVTIASFANGPEIDSEIVEAAMDQLRKRGEIKDQFPEDYSPGIPGRQLNLFTANGRQIRNSLYMADHRLYITETDAAPGEFAALQFEQSVLLIDENGGDLNAVANRNRYACGK